MLLDTNDVAILNIEKCPRQCFREWTRLFSDALPRAWPRQSHRQCIPVNAVLYLMVTCNTRMHCCGHDGSNASECGSGFRKHWPILGDSWKVTKSTSCRPGQEEVPCAIGLDCWSVLFSHSQEDSPASWRCSLLLCEQCDTSHKCNDGNTVPSKSSVSLCYC